MNSYVGLNVVKQGIYLKLEIHTVAALLMIKFTFMEDRAEEKYFLMICIVFELWIRSEVKTIQGSGKKYNLIAQLGLIQEHLTPVFHIKTGI